MKTTNKGFTLIEIIVSVSLFSIVSIVAITTVLTVNNAAKKTQTVRAVLDNLNFGLESVMRKVRGGEIYHCGDVTLLGTSIDSFTPNDCPNGGNVFYFMQTNEEGEHYVRKYYLNEEGRLFTQTIKQDSSCTLQGWDQAEQLTSPEVEITNLNFYVSGSALSPENMERASVIMIAKGKAKGKPGLTETEFSIESMAVERSIEKALPEGGDCPK